MSNLRKGKKVYNPTYFTVSVEEGLKKNLYRVFKDGSFEEIDFFQIRIDRALEEPIGIMINDQEYSLTLNDEYGILFEDEFALEEFLNELFFVMETYNEVDEKDRTTSDKKVLSIKELMETLGYKEKGEENGEFNDSEISERQEH